ncbi:HD-GYP domain-containing protein [Bacillus alveayuensis]|uniref:HD-GYP domain-containing protein n=1 Tax=Aeribacillus alveayuensis TaxID=279215 RepID=UPI0005CCB011|nr:HD-GYP domain-containing protein [Bacillus alveayuensis]
MRVKVDLLREGCVLSEDVYSLTNKPIVRKNTVLESKHIHALKAFLIKEVDIKRETKSGKDILNQDINEEFIEEENLLIEDLYLDAVKKYKKMFFSWQAGAPVNMSLVRELVLPLVEKALDDPLKIMGIYKKCDSEQYFYFQSLAVSLLSAVIAKELKYSQGDINQVALAGFLSDCGMSKINSSIIFKKEMLTEQEFKEIKQHPIYSYKMLKELPSLTEATKLSILQHHEKLDGSGYPLGFKGEQLHPFGKIIAVANIYQAMISPRPYRPRLSPFYTLEVIEKDEFGKLDLTIIKVLKKLFRIYMNGRRVGLSDGTVGKIVFIDEKSVINPLVSLHNTSEVIKISKNGPLKIEEVF